MNSGNPAKGGLRHESCGNALEEQRHGDEEAGKEAADSRAQGQQTEEERADAKEEPHEDERKHEAR